MLRKSDYYIKNIHTSEFAYRYTDVCHIDSKYGLLLNSKEYIISVMYCYMLLVFNSSEEIDYRIAYGNMITMDIQVIDVLVYR